MFGSLSCKQFHWCSQTTEAQLHCVCIDQGQAKNDPAPRGNARLLPKTGETIKAMGRKFELVDLDGQRVDSVLATHPGAS